MLNIQDVEKKEKKLENRIEEYRKSQIREFQKYYLEKKLCSHQDDDIRRVALELVSDKHYLSKIHTRYGSIKTDLERLDNLIPQAIYNWKHALIQCQIKDNQKRLPELATNVIKLEEVLKRIQELYDLRKELAKYLGDRVVNPKS